MANGDTTMTAPVDLPPNVASEMLRLGMAQHQQGMGDISINAAHIHNITRGSIVRKFDEVSTMESRANSGIMATPIASPTTQTP